MFDYKIDNHLKDRVMVSSEIAYLLFRNLKEYSYPYHFMDQFLFCFNNFDNFRSEQIKD